MIRIFSNEKRSEFMVQTTTTELGVFVSELGEAIQAIVGADDEKALMVISVIERAIPIAFKLSGYKAEDVIEQRTLACGLLTPSQSNVIATVGR